MRPIAVILISLIVVGLGCTAYVCFEKYFKRQRVAAKLLIFIAEQNMRDPETREIFWQKNCHLYKDTESYYDGILFDVWKVSVVRELTMFYYEELFHDVPHF